ncbi:N1-acetylpolyamine oxidase [Ceratocystis lukuohia]|uniref:N1-acetylpolyamine oxidase n=1 Tax=Ceratocystis lukuohia TaxID=2019550 RepID=A0ABR4MUC7_9PEZI
MRQGAPDRGVAVLNDAFTYLNNELKSMSPQVIKELLLGLVNGDPAMVTALSKFFSAWTAKNLERSHPLRPIFTALYSILQEHGAQTLSDLIWTTMPSFIDDLEAIYGRKHPYVASSLLDLLELAEEQHLRLQHLQPDQTLEEYRSRVTHLITELHPVLENIESVEGIQSTDATALRYMLLQMQHSVMPGTSTTHIAAADLHRQMRQTGRLFQMQYAAAGLFCYHEPIKVTPSMRRCRHRYDSVAKLLQMHENLAISFYFEEDMHNGDHALTSSDASHHLPYNGNAGGGGNGNDSGNGNGNGSNAALAAAFGMQPLGGGLGGGFAWS